MSPHLETEDGAWVRNTEYATGDTTSRNAIKAIALVREHPERYILVTDKQVEVGGQDLSSKSAANST
jgi:hypothetical protein